MSSTHQSQNSLLAAAQQFASAAAAAQQFAAVAQIMAMTNGGQQSENQSFPPSPPSCSAAKKKVRRRVTDMSSPQKTSKKTPPRVRQSVGRECDDELGEEEMKAVSNFWSSLGVIDEGKNGGNLPRESEQSERKRPAAIQELLQMKKQRLCNPSTGADQGAREGLTEELLKVETARTELKDGSVSQQCSPSKSPMSGANSHLSEIINQICNGHDKEDTETTTSSGSHGSNGKDDAHHNGDREMNGDSKQTSCSRRKHQKPVALISVKNETEDEENKYFLTDEDLFTAVKTEEGGGYHDWFGIVKAVN